MPEFRYIGLGALKERANLALRETLEEVGDEFEQDVKHTMPHLSEAMDASTVIGPITGGGERLTRKLVVGERYAVFEHEKLWYQHDDGRAKFVKFPLLRAAPRLRARLSAAAARRF
jgi:hypothetical protein